MAGAGDLEGWEADGKPYQLKYMSFKLLVFIAGYFYNNNILTQKMRNIEKTVLLSIGAVFISFAGIICLLIQSK
jgi:hypothetical protein